MFQIGLKKGTLYKAGLKYIEMYWFKDHEMNKASNFGSSHKKGRENSLLCQLFMQSESW